MIKQLFSSLSDKVHTSSMWITRRTSFTFLIGRGSDGKEKMLLLQSKQEPQTQTQTPSSEPESVVNGYSGMFSSYNFGDGKLISADKEATKIDLAPMFPQWVHDKISEEYGQRFDKETVKKSNWFSCFTYQTGSVPRWLLALVLFLAILVLAWVCCATAATAPDQHIRRQVGIGSDLPFLMLHNEPPAKLVLVDDAKDPGFGDEKKKLAMMSGEMPPTYEEAQLQPKFEILLSSEPLVVGAEAEDEKKIVVES